MASRVIPVMGQFKNKSNECFKCDSKWDTHEEKEIDLNLALALLELAYDDKYDRAVVLTRDSDLTPAILKVKQKFPHKQITVLSPHNYRHGSELVTAADSHTTISLKHISKSLFPPKIYDAEGNLVVERPLEYGLLFRRIKLFKVEKLVGFP
jgi:uncharacterized LabA/DUF88 family protein